MHHERDSDFRRSAMRQLLELDRARIYEELAKIRRFRDIAVGRISAVPLMTSVVIFARAAKRYADRYPEDPLGPQFLQEAEAFERDVSSLNE